MYTDIIITLVGGGASFGPAICYLPRWHKNESCQGLLWCELRNFWLTQIFLGMEKSPDLFGDWKNKDMCKD